MCKILTNILLSRLTPYVEEIIGDHQCGFRHNVLTIEHIFWIPQVRKKKLECNEAVHQLFIDFKKAYDLFRREVLYNILIEFGIPTKLVKVIKMCLNETYSGVWLDKHLSDMFPIKNVLRQGGALSPLLFNFAINYAIRRVQVNKDGLNLNGTHELLVYADDVNILGRSVHPIKKKTEVLVVVGKEIGLEVNADKTQYMVMSRDQNAEQSQNLKTDNSSFERVKQFMYVGKPL
jgi:sorting nexin-29